MHLSLELLSSHASNLQKQFEETSALIQQIAGALSYVKGQIEELNKVDAKDENKSELIQSKTKE